MLARLRRLWGDERGSITIGGLFLFLSCCIVGAAALDVTHLYAARTQLQAAADLAAHAALYNRSRESSRTSRARAMALVHDVMPPDAYGRVLRAGDITFGTWDQDKRAFTSDASSRSAVRVVTGRDESTGNSVPSLLFRLVGVDQFDVSAQSVFATTRPPCLREGLVAGGAMKILSSNFFSDGFCLHSNVRVEVQIFNVFEPGAMVSMPDPSAVPSMRLRSNVGLEVALRRERYDQRILDRMSELRDGVTTMGTAYTPAYLTSASAIDLVAINLLPSDFTAGRVHRHASCDADQTIMLASGTYRNFVLDAADCRVEFDNNVILADVVIATTSTSAASFKGPAGGNGAISIGRIDGCAEGGGAQLLTMGGVRFPASVQVHGGQILALGDVQLAGQTAGVGISVVAGGRIDGGSNMTMVQCGSGMEDNFEADYFRLVR